MWILFGGLAIVTAVLNLFRTVKRKDASVFRFASLAFTALTLCAFFSLAGRWVAAEDWAALMDVVPAMSKLLWVCTVVSITVNGLSLFPIQDR